MARTAISDALAAAADLIILPELVTSGYVIETDEELNLIAMSDFDELFDSWRGLIGDRESVIVAGFAQRGEDGLVYNSAAVVDRTGLRAIYQKNHLWDEEKRWFEPGKALPPVIQTAFGKLGVLICYDLEFPETARDLALRGAEIIAVPTNWPLAYRPVGERPPEIGNAMVCARVNRVFIACCDREGTERGTKWTGGSCIVSPDGWVLAEREGRDGGMISADIDVSLAADKSINRNNDALGDRRPNLYRSLAE